MDNLTHSLVGATLAELALPRDATRTTRRLFFTAGVIAANLPDADLVYTRIMPDPLGYLLHHRGHTHTVLGLVAQALLVGAVCMLPAVRRAASPHGARLGSLIALALASHLVLDSWNSYGVHPFWPLDSRWIYGDAIYILDPWLWLLLGTAAALNTRRRAGGIALGALLAAIVGAAAWKGMIPVEVFVALVIGALAVGASLRALAPRRRSMVALSLAVAYVAGMFAVRAHVRATALASGVVTPASALIDLVLSPQPANPLCWSALAVQRDARVATYTLTKGTVSAVGASGCGASAARVRWERPVTQSAGALRSLVARDCWARAWMQFGRAPDLDGRTLSDARYGGRARANFSTLQLEPAAATRSCPAAMTRWGMPREDLLR